MKKPHTVSGIISITRGGSGFVVTPKGDVFIPPQLLNTALHKDVVEISVGKDAKGRLEGKVVAIEERAQNEFVGTVVKKEGFFYLEADNPRMYRDIVLPSAPTPKEGEKVVVKMNDWNNPDASPEGVITEVIGTSGEHNTEMQAIVRKSGFDTRFPSEVTKAAEKIDTNREKIFAQAEKEIAGGIRRDFREVTTFTMDPADAKDFDDALSIKDLGNGKYEVGIHIADVSAYIKNNDAIDLEAQKRGTSIYLVDRTIPMLPEVLSNDLCSLMPNIDRLCFSAVFTIDTSGKIHDRWFGQGIIHSDKRFSYEEGQKTLDEKRGELYEELNTLNTIAHSLRKKRFANGSIGFETDEVKFKLDKNGKPVSVYKKQRTETMLLIEDFMLLANQEVATEIYRMCEKSAKRNNVFVYRIHDMPDPEKIEELSIFLRAIGYDLKHKNGMTTAKDINKLLKEVEGTPEESLIKTATIRSMAKAVYSTKNIGHFGLAFKYYTHFTSPIRRYPDLMVHRLLRKHLDGSKISQKEFTQYERLAVQSSEREISAVEAERDSIKYKQVEYMQEHIGKMFKGVISGITDWGIYVEENETKAEGLVPISKIAGDYFEKSSKYTLVGQKTKRKFSLGDEVTVKLKKTNLEERTIDWELV